MHDFAILIPFGLPPAAMAPDLLRALQLPALSTLLARATAAVDTAFDPFACCLPHEAWLENQLQGKGDSAALPTSNSPALAVRRMAAQGLACTQGVWFLLQPVHIHIARDHLVLTDGRRTLLSEEESRALFTSALPSFEQAGKTLVYGSAHCWFVRADDWATLHTATPDAACGHNIDIWLPTGEGERDWRKLQNDVQMEWHAHPVNTARAENYLPPVNSLWLWGGATAPLPPPPLAQATLPPLFFCSGKSHSSTALYVAGETIANLGLSLALNPLSNTVLSPLSNLITVPGPRLLVLDDLSESALAEEWGSWLEQMRLLETQWFAPLLQALRAGQIKRSKLIFTHNTRLRAFDVSRQALLKFWAAPSLKSLLP